MRKHFIRIVSLVLAILLLTTTFAAGSFALEWDGDSVDGGGNGSAAGMIGFALRTTGDNVLGYRFSLVDASGNNKVSKVIDVFRNTKAGNSGYSTLYRFVPKYNKSQLIKNQDGAFSTSKKLTNSYKEADMGFATVLPTPEDMVTWQNNTTNLNKILATLGAGSIDDLVLGDKVIVEPIYDVRLESVWHAVTVTEIAVYGKHIFGADTKIESSKDSETFGFIANYTNKHYPNELFTPDGQGLWTGATATSKRLTFRTIINYGYGVGIAYTQETGTIEPDLIVDLCEAWPGEFGYYTDLHGYSVGPTFDDWSYERGYPIMGEDVWFDIRFPREAKNYYVRQTVSIDGSVPTSREVWSDRGLWYSVAPEPTTVSADKAFYTIVARVDWIDEDGTVLKYGAEKTFYIPVQPKLNRYEVIAYGCTGREQASSGMDGSSGAVYYGQRIYTRYQYTSDSSWTSYNNLYATMYHWDGKDWESTYDGPDGKLLNTAMSSDSTKTTQSALGFTIVPNNSASGKNVIPFNMTTEWTADPLHTQETDRYEIPILIADVALEEIYLVNANGARLDHTKLTIGQTVYIRYKYRNNTNCTVYVDGFNTNRESISATGVYRIPANGVITVAGGSMVVTEEDFSIWGGVYLEGAGLYNTEYERDGTNNELTLNCNASYPLELSPIVPNAAYREDTSVITSFWLINNGSTDVTPDSNISIRMRVYSKNGALITTKTVSLVIVPSNDRNLYYFKWDVPKGLSGASVRIKAEIIEDGIAYGGCNRGYATRPFPDYDTPDTDYEAKAPDGFTVSSIPTATSNYAAWWQWAWENGEFVRKFYGIGIPKTSSETLTPDEHSNSTFSGGYWTIKSGYGVWLRAPNRLSRVSGYEIPGTDAYTVPQFAYAAYPEFSYKYGADLCTTLTLRSGFWYFSDPSNPKYHYTPIYFPDGRYVVKIVKSDMWTPAGMIGAVSTTKPITVKDAAYDDWFVGRE